MKNHPPKIPILYVYIFKVIKEHCQRITTSRSISKCISTIIYRAPKIVIRDIINELESYGLIKSWGYKKTNCELPFNKKIMKEINEIASKTVDEKRKWFLIRKYFKLLEKFMENPRYEILLNEKIEMKINELRDYLFPFSP